MIDCENWNEGNFVRQDRAIRMKISVNFPITSLSSKPMCTWENFFGFNVVDRHVLYLAHCPVHTGQLACHLMHSSKQLLLRWGLNFPMNSASKPFFSVPKRIAEEQNRDISDFSWAHCSWQHCWGSNFPPFFLHNFISFRNLLFQAEIWRSFREANCFHSKDVNGWECGCYRANAVCCSSRGVVVLHGPRREEGEKPTYRFFFELGIQLI